MKTSKAKVRRVIVAVSGPYGFRVEDWESGEHVFDCIAETFQFCCGVKEVGEFAYDTELIKGAAFKAKFRDWIRSIGTIQVATLINRQKDVVEPLLLYAGFKEVGRAKNDGKGNLITLYTRTGKKE